MSPGPESAMRTILRASWASIGLGLLFEALQLGALTLGGGHRPPAVAILADTAQKVSWSYVVCVALATGTAATRARPAAIAGLGLLAAPLAFGVARTMHKSVAQLLNVGVPAGGPSPWLLAGIKAAEYALFGYLVARLVRRPGARLTAYLRTGLVIGVLFGAAIVWIMDRAAPPPGLTAATLVARSVNEMLFPVGCATLLWVTNSLGRRAA